MQTWIRPPRFRRPTPAAAVLTVIAALLIQRFRSADESTPAGRRAMETVVVQRVIDGDTLALEDGRRVRLRGIDAPELGRFGSPSEKGAEAARGWLRQRIEGHTVQLLYETRRLDNYGRTLAWVFAENGRLINQELLAEGHARLLTAYGLPPEFAAALHRSTARARAQHRGLWK